MAKVIIGVPQDCASRFTRESDSSCVQFTKTSQDEYILLYPRRLVKYRGYKIFIDMCEQLKKKGYRIRAVVAFEKSGCDDYTHLFENKTCTYEIVNPSLEEIPPLYSQAFLTFIPSTWSEGTSLSAIEAICSGCPVITSDVGGLGNIVIPDMVGEIIAPTVESFVKITEKVLNNIDIRERWADNCLIMRQSFCSSKWNEKMKEIIAQLERD